MKSKGKKKRLKRKVSDEELNQASSDPDSENFQLQWEETEDRVHFIRSRRVVDGVKTGFPENIQNIGFQDSDELNSLAVLNME